MESLFKLGRYVLKETFPNEHIRNYHLKFEKVTKKQMESILQIPGVISELNSTVYIPERYLLRVEKGKAFKWKEIEIKLLTILLKKGDKKK